MATYLFRLLGDFCHLFSILILIYKIHTRKTTAGISLRTRVLYMFVFLARYGDLFLYFISFYNTFMKLLYLSATGYIIFLMTISPEFKNTWYHDLDNFATLPLVIAAAVLALICTARYTVFEIMWTFSIILESVAILPQIDHLTKVPTLPALPLTHLVALGLYRLFYVLNWAVKLISEGTWDFTGFFFGVLQTAIWADFLVVWYYRKQIKLPPNSTGQGLRSEEEGTTGGQVDEGDMSSSFVITHIFTCIRMVEDRFMPGRKLPGLSVSAYPAREEARGSGPSTTGAYSDDAGMNAPVPADNSEEYVIRVPTPVREPVENAIGSVKNTLPEVSIGPVGQASAPSAAYASDNEFDVDSEDGSSTAR